MKQLITQTRRKSRSLGEVLFPSIRRRLLARFYSAPDRRYYAGEIAGLIKATLPPVRHELTLLADIGILNVEKAGHHRYYWLNQDCMIYAELQSIILKTFGVAEVITAALKPCQKNVVAAFVYGSVAAGTDTAKSDIDLLIIGRLSLREVSVALKEVEAALGRPVNPTVYPPEEFMEKSKSGNHFIRTVLTGQKIFVIGTSDDLRELAGK